MTTSPAEFSRANANCIGGDIVTGANTPLQMAFRPRVTLKPYDTGCSPELQASGRVGLQRAFALPRALFC